MNKAPLAVICLSPYQGGMEIDSIKLALMLARVTDVTLIAKQNTFIASEFPKHDNPNDVSLETIAFKSSLSPSIISRVRKIIKTKGIRNVLFLGASELKSLYFAFLGLEINLIIRHGTTKSSPKKDWFHRLIYSKVNYHVAICEHLARNIEYIIPFGKYTKLKVVYPSLNLMPSQPIDFDAKPHKPLQLLHVGRIAKGKGQMVAIKACEVLYKHGIDFCFNIVGGYHETYKKEFQDYLNTVVYKDKINLVGHTSNVEYYYLNSDVFLFPSDGEGLSNAFIEALSYGLHCISYDNTSFPELKQLGFIFSLVNNQDVHHLKHTLLQCTTDYFSADELRQNHNLSQSLFSEHHEIHQLSQLLQGTS